MQNFFIVTGAPTTLLPLYAAFKNAKERPGEFELLTSILFALYSMLFLYGAYTTLFCEISVPEELEKISKQTGFSSETFIVFLNHCDLFFVGLNIGYYFIVKKTKHALTYSILFSVVALILAACTLNYLFDYNIIDGIFLELCGIMAFCAFLAGSTYKIVCVIGNIYFQWGICLFFALAPVVLFLRTRKERETSQANIPTILFFVFTLINLIVHTIVLYKIWTYYGSLTLDQQFDQWYNDLIYMSQNLHCSYNWVNIIFFVLVYVLDLGWNGAIYLIMKRLTNPSTKNQYAKQIVIR